jgi:hypothetical protein
MNPGRFYLGLHQPRDASHVDRAFISANRLRGRESGFLVNEWVMDSGAFTEITTHGRYRADVEEYAALIRRYARWGELVAAVAQDFMCEPFALKATGLTVADHQRLTIERYRDLIACDTAGIYIMPVLQGQLPVDYVRHIEAYGDLLAHGAWIGVGSVCKRQGSPRAIIQVLHAIHAARPDLRLHGFGVKVTALSSAEVRQHLDSADSMAWSFAARMNGHDQNDPWVARRWELDVLRATGWEWGAYAEAFARMLVDRTLRQMSAADFSAALHRAYPKEQQLDLLAA